MGAYLQWRKVFLTSTPTPSLEHPPISCAFLGETWLGVYSLVPKCQFHSQSSRAWSMSPKNHNPHLCPPCKSLLHMTTAAMSVSSINPSALPTKNPGRTEGF